MTDTSDEILRMIEKWKPITGYEGLYEISDHGRVRSLHRTFVDRLGRTQKKPGVIKNPGTTHNGYLLAFLSNGGKQSAFQIHRLVMAAFVGQSNLQVNHKDRNPTNNHLSNLEYVTPRENIHHFRDGSRDLPIGVSRHYGRYRARACFDGVQKSLGTFDTVTLAHNAIIQAIAHERTHHE